MIFLAQLTNYYRVTQIRRHDPDLDSKYAADPSAEIKQSLVLLKDKPLWKERYEEFIEAMVYDSTNALPYDQAITVLEGISASVINRL